MGESSPFLSLVPEILDVPITDDDDITFSTDIGCAGR